MPDQQKAQYPPLEGCVARLPSACCWLAGWAGPETAAEAAAIFARLGHVVILADADAQGLPSPLPQEQALAPHRAHPEGFLIRRGITRALAAQILGGAAADYPIDQNAAGAPRITAGLATGLPAGLHVSFSARANVGVIALGRAPLGVDFEPALPPAGIAWNILRADEREMLEKLPVAQQEEAFLTLWRAKEAVLKAMGCGFSRPPEAVWLEGDFAHIDAQPQQFRLVSSPEMGLTLAILLP